MTHDATESSFTAPVSNPMPADLSATAASPGVATPDLGGELRSLVRTRWAGIAFLALTAGLARSLGFLDSGWPLVCVCAGMAAYNFLLTVRPPPGARAAAAVFVSLVLDICGLTAFLHFSGDIENPLMFGYALPAVAGGLILSRRAGMATATVALGLAIALLGLTYSNAIPIHLLHHHLELIPGLNLHHHVDPDLSAYAWNYVFGHLLALVAVTFGAAHGAGLIGQRIREKERLLAIQNERLVLLLSILREGVVLLDRGGAILWTNPASRRLLPELATARQVIDLEPSLGLQSRFTGLDRLLLEFETNAENRRLVHALLRPSADPRVVWVFRDVAAERRLMAQAMHDAKMRDLGLLAAGIAHEIGNPLSSMSAILQIIEMKNAAPELKDRWRALGDHVERIGRIVRDITGFARPSAGPRAAADLGAIVQQALRIFRLHEKARSLEVDCRPLPAGLAAPVVEDQIVQVLLNLLLNAADASEPIGRIEVSMEAAGGEACISVADQGSGMDEETRRRLFTPFFTTKEPGKGVGLGLFISESIVREHGGRIEVRSEPGRGSTFTVCLPLPDRAASPAPGELES